MNIVDQLKTIKKFPCFFNMYDCLAIGKYISMQEVLELKGFSKDKSLGLDGWNVEFYLQCFDLVGKDLVEAAEETKISGKIP